MSKRIFKSMAWGVVVVLLAGAVLGCGPQATSPPEPTAAPEPTEAPAAVEEPAEEAEEPAEEEAEEPAEEAAEEPAAGEVPSSKTAVVAWLATGSGRGAGDRCRAPSMRKGSPDRFPDRGGCWNMRRWAG